MNIEEAVFAGLICDNRVRMGMQINEYVVSFSHKDKTDTIVLAPTDDSPYCIYQSMLEASRMATTNMNKIFTTLETHISRKSPYPYIMVISEWRTE